MQIDKGQIIDALKSKRDHDKADQARRNGVGRVSDDRGSVTAGTR